MKGILDSFNINTFQTDGNRNILEAFYNSDIMGFQFFNGVNLAMRDSTMFDNFVEKSFRLGTHYSAFNGAHTKGDSRFLTPNAQKANYSYSSDMDYYGNYVSKPSYFPQTKEMVSGDGYQHNYVDLYSNHDNKYPDEKNGLHNSGKLWTNLDNQESLMAKTKELFNQNKINTIISAFHTDNGLIGYDETDAHSTFGLSHGRNLLLKSTEDGGQSESPNPNISNYDNPYCRVWTHHYQYDRLDKLIRPFVVRGENGDSVARKLIDLHTWSNQFTPEHAEINSRFFGWKNHNPRWFKSVLNDNGHINITPKFKQGGAMSLHTKQCMFSIENLAWKGMSPFEFEKNLSWEQRGPMGGRIMWFPPYGVSFSETTNATWNNQTFIGRGEDVYTYVNTKRTGTLSFLMVVDHPSVTDYSTWYRQGQQLYDALKDSDWLRYFAGCDSGLGNTQWKGGSYDRDGWDSVNSFTAPPPYTSHEGKRPEDLVPKDGEDPIEPEKPTTEVPPSQPTELTFYVFYPNNYSGMYDKPTKGDSDVNFAAYLINGIGTQKKSGDNTYNESNVSEVIKATSDILIDEKTYDKLLEDRGYEIYKHNNGEQRGIGQENGSKEYIPIFGTQVPWYSKLPKEYPFDIQKRYHYRVDGMYKVPKSGSSEIYSNTYDDQFKIMDKGKLVVNEKNYQDTTSFGYNSSLGLNDVLKHFQVKSTKEKPIFAFTEIIAALYNGQYAENFIKMGIVNKDNVEYLRKIFYDDGNKIVEVNGFGGASKHALTNASKSNQVNLCNNRYLSVANLLRAAQNSNFTKDGVKWNTKITLDEQKSITTNSVSASEAKLARYAKIVITVQTDESNSLSNTKSTVDNKVKSNTTKSNGVQIDNVNPYFDNLDDLDIERIVVNGGEYIISCNGDNFVINDKTIKGKLKETKTWIPRIEPRPSDVVSDVVNSFEYYDNNKPVVDFICYESVIDITEADGSTHIGNCLRCVGRLYDSNGNIIKRFNGIINREAANVEDDDINNGGYITPNDMSMLFDENYNKLSQIESVSFNIEGVGTFEINDKVISVNGKTYKASDYKDEYSKVRVRKSDPIYGDIIYTTKNGGELAKNIVTLLFEDEAQQYYFGVDIIPYGNDYVDIVLYSEKYNISSIGHLVNMSNPIYGNNADDDENVENKNVESVQELYNNELSEVTVTAKKLHRNNNSQHYDMTKNLNWVRYDQEYRFFKELELNHPVIFDNLMQKLQYFDPAFHSMTPEGFNARLAFLHQCTRQGNTVGATDQSGQATNLAFGRPPFCVLRLGDFYNQMIVIDSIHITYDTDSGVQWDLNPEGNGVQPLLAKISINFNFVGGGDMYGPVRRLQNAMTFNYYANQGLYDNRSDFEIRAWDNEKADANPNNKGGIVEEWHYLPKRDERIKPNMSGNDAETLNNK